MRKMLLSALTCLAATAAIGEEPAPAECPQFIGPLPNVIITDFNSAGVADTPANFFVFVDAFDLYDYIDLGSTGLTDATFAFNEFVKGSSVPSTGDMRIYSINGELGAPAVPTTPAEIDAASVDSGGTIAAEGILGLRNVKLSAVGESTFPAPNGDDVTSPGNTRTITIYIIAPSSSGACYQFGSIDVRSFDAITELGSVDSSDRLEEAGCTFVPFVDYPTFDSGWNFGKLHADFTSIPASLVEPGTISGYNGSPPAGTQTIGIASAAELDNTFAVWRRNLGVPLEGETIYRIRSLVNSNATVNQSNWARIRFGGDFLGENGQGEQGYTANASSMPTTPRMQNFLHWVKRSSAGNSLPGSSDQPAYNFDLIDEVQSTGGHFVTIGGVTIDTLTRDCLGPGTVIRNKGVLNVSNEDGQTPVADGLTPFATGEGYIVDRINDAGSTVAISSSTATPVEGAMNITFLTTEPGDQTGFGALFVSENPGEASVEIDNSKIYAMDLWISAPIAGNSTTSRLPVMRTRWIADQTISHNHGQTHSSYYDLNPDQDFNGLLDNPNGITLANSSNHFAAFWWPDLDLVAQPVTTSRYFLDFIYNRAGGAAVRPNGTFSVERMTITEYDQPTF